MYVYCWVRSDRMFLFIFFIEWSSRSILLYMKLHMYMWSFFGTYRRYKLFEDASSKVNSVLENSSALRAALDTVNGMNALLKARCANLVEVGKIWTNVNTSTVPGCFWYTSGGQLNLKSESDNAATMWSTVYVRCAYGVLYGVRTVWCMMGHTMYDVHYMHMYMRSFMYNNTYTTGRSLYEKNK